MIDLDTLRKANGYVLAIVDESTGEYKPVSSDVVQVIQCKDCKHYLGLAECRLIGECGGTKFYCGWSERKE